MLEDRNGRTLIADAIRHGVAAGRHREGARLMPSAEAGWLKYADLQSSKASALLDMVCQGVAAPR